MAKQNRIFALGEKVRIAKKSRIVDLDRRMEGLLPNGDAKPPLDVDVTGESGEVCAQPYESPHRDEVMVPIRLPNEAVIAVPEDRLERTETPPPPSVLREEERIVTGDGPGPSAVSRETIEFWRQYFAMEAKAKAAKGNKEE